MRHLLYTVSFAFTVVASAQILDIERALRDKNLGALTRVLEAGEYEQAARYAVAVIDDGKADPTWHHILMRALVAVGDSERALTAAEHALMVHPADLSLLAARYRIASSIGKKELAQQTLDALNAAAKVKPAASLSAADLAALGEAALALGADPQLVLKQYFSAAKRKDAKSAAPYFASAELAMTKGDYARAAEEFRSGMKATGESADYRAGLARAFAPSDRKASLGHIEKALELNPRHEAALLLRAEHEISSELFPTAAKTLDELAQTNPTSPPLWAYRSVLATLQENDSARAAEQRTTALKPWPQNPLVDYLIGKCLSRAYRFTEGAEHQRAALSLHPDYALSQLQLCHDLMRLGDTEAAWKLATEIRAKDEYNTQAHNLGLLEREMSGFHTEKAADFQLRMPQRDWQVYGPRALALLREAAAKLGPKYGWSNGGKPTLVEFLPTQQDFAIRTFGSLGGQGLLGVCFGTVITMNSPGSLAAGRNNWESTLWHEFAHVITLSTTKNRMPRWLSEGLSVYEERQHDPAWGMRMNAENRRLILEEEALTPVSQMSSAFLNAKDGEAILFAYYQSSMVVEWIIQKHGWPKLLGTLRSLADGQRINAALEKNVMPLDELEPAFQAWITTEAKKYGEKADWSKPESAEPAEHLKQHPKNLTALYARTAELLEEKAWPAAAALAQRIMQLEPEAQGARSGHWLYAKALRGMDRPDEERTVLHQLATRSGEALPIFQRLMELDQSASAWPELERSAAQAFALQPFLAGTSQSLALSTSKQGNNTAAIAHYQRLLLLNPPLPAVIHFQLALLLRESDAPSAKRHVLDALALAPRYTAALGLLKEMK